MSLTEKLNSREAAGFETLLARLAGSTAEAKYQRDQVVFSQGDPADSVLHLRSGKVKVLIVSEAGKSAVVGILQAGSFCGEECLVGHASRLTTVKTLVDSTLVRIERASMVRALQDDQRLSEMFILYLTERNVRMQEDLADLLLNSTEKRLARLLLILANYRTEPDGAEPQPAPVLPRINQETLAEMVGASRTHVNFFMNRFRQQGLIEYNGDIKVNAARLSGVLHEKPRVDPGD